VKESVFPVLPGLEDAVKFWKQIFTRFGSNEVVFFDRSKQGCLLKSPAAIEERWCDHGRSATLASAAKTATQSDRFAEFVAT
jgi:hypothetical protein